MQHSFVELEIHCGAVKGGRLAGLWQIESGRRQSITIDHKGQPEALRAVPPESAPRYQERSLGLDSFNRLYL
jgi:hypothetical protein